MVATPKTPRKGPRIRKTAPTIREQVEAAQAESIKPQPVRARSRLKNNQVSRVVGVVFKPLRKVLGWLVPRYFINSWREVRQVTWPTRRETWRLTGAVFVFAIIFGSLVAIVDKGLDEIFKKVILKQ